MAFEMADVRSKIRDPYEDGPFHKVATANASIALEAARERQTEHDALSTRLEDARRGVAIRERDVSGIETTVEELREYVLRSFARGDNEEVAAHQGAVARAEDETLPEARGKLEEARRELEDATYDPLEAERSLVADLKALLAIIPADRNHAAHRAHEYQAIGQLLGLAEREAYRLNIERIKTGQQRRRASGEKTITSTNQITDSKASPDPRWMRPGQVLRDVDDD